MGVSGRERTAGDSEQRRKGELGGTLTSRRHVLAGYVIWVTLLIAAYYAWPGLRVETWGLIGLSGVSAIVAGVGMNHPARQAPGLFLGAADPGFSPGRVGLL